jgi:hypothetical protein
LFRKKYHVLPPLLASHSQYNSAEKFIEWLKEMDLKTGAAEYFFHIGDKKLVDSNLLFKNKNIYWNEYAPWDENKPIDKIDFTEIPNIWSVSEYAITLAIYMGFEKIYLIGIDHDWFNGPMVYFYDKKNEHKLQPDEKNIDFVDSEYQMRRHAYIFRKYKNLYNMKKNIYNANANPKTYVDVFPKVDYDSLF